MKKIIILCVLFLLVGCANYSQERLSTELDSYFSNLDDYRFRLNNNTEYYSYYLPSDTVEIAYDNENTVFRYLNSKIVLNINISSIINNKYFSEHILDDEGFFDQKKLAYSFNGSYIDVNDTEVDYIIKIYGYEDYMLIHLFTEKVNMFGYCLKEEAAITAKHMMLMARGVKVEEEKYLNNYSPKNNELYERNPVDLFQYIIPEEGYLQDLLVENESKGK